jgi:hypothetical protein
MAAATFEKSAQRGLVMRRVEKRPGMARFPRFTLEQDFTVRAITFADDVKCLTRHVKRSHLAQRSVSRRSKLCEQRFDSFVMPATRLGIGLFGHSTHIIMLTDDDECTAKAVARSSAFAMIAARCRKVLSVRPSGVTTTPYSL